MDLPDPPEGWALKFLSANDPDERSLDHAWTAHLWAHDEYVYGYGTSARYAMLDALRRIEEGKTYGRMSGITHSTVDLVKALGIVKQPQRVRRL